MIRRKRLCILAILGGVSGLWSCGDDTPPAVFLYALESVDIPQGTTHELTLRLTSAVMTKSYVDVTNPAPTKLEIPDQVVIDEGASKATVRVKGLDLTSSVEVVFSLRGGSSSQIWRVGVVDPNG